MTSRRGTAPPSPCPAPSFLVNPPPSPWVSSVRSGPSIAGATRASASAISSASRLEREHYLRQNRDISRLCSLKSAQIRQFEAKLSKLERENLGMRIALREAESGLKAKDRMQAASSSSSSSTSVNFSDLQDADTSAEVIVPKAAQRKATNDAVLLQEVGGHESADDDNTDSSDGARRHKRRKLSRRASPFGPKTFLLSKLNQVQAIYQREHQALCTLMASFNSTSRFYKDLLQQLEEHALYTSKGIGVESSGEHALDLREPASPQHSQHHQQRKPEPNGEILQSPHSSPRKRLYSEGSSGSTSRGTLKGHRRQPSSSPSPSPFFKPTRYLRKRPRQLRSKQKSKSPSAACSEDLFLSSSKPSGPTPEITLPSCDKATQDVEDLEDNHVVGPRVPRLSTRNVFNMNTLPRIAEDEPPEPSGTMAETRDKFTLLRSRVSVSAEFLGPATPRDATVGEPEIGRSDRSNVQESIARNLKPSSSSPGARRAKHKDIGSSEYRVESNRRIGDYWATRNPQGERAKSIALSKALLAKFSKSAPSSDGSGDIDAPEQPRAASMQATTTVTNPDVEVFGSSGNVKPNLEDGDGSDLQGENTLQEPLTHEDDTSQTRTTIPSTRHDGVKRSIIARRRGIFRATPSPLVKSRSAIRAQHLKVMTPAQLLRRMNKTLLGTSKAPALPRSITRNESYSSISSTKTPSLLTDPSPSTLANDTPMGSDQNEQDYGSSEDAISARKLMPPPPAPAPKFPKKYISYRSKPASKAEASVKGPGSVSSTDDSGETESMTIGDRDDGQEIGDDATIQEGPVGTSYRSSSKRVGAPSIAYKLPNLRK
ncbi:hypothetical protein BGZ68_005731 [Mortierella alpina]|nr:hypothetical protein BGZ68_005731 [Mortierella alpina]